LLGKKEGRKEGRVGFCLEFGVKNFLGRRKEGKDGKEGRGGFCVEFGVRKCFRKRRKRWVLSRIWCWKMLEEKKEEKGFCVEFGVGKCLRERRKKRGFV
jgi:hypothetical protein